MTISESRSSTSGDSASSGLSVCFAVRGVDSDPAMAFRRAFCFVTRADLIVVLLVLLIFLSNESYNTVVNQIIFQILRL